MAVTYTLICKIFKHKSEYQGQIWFLIYMARLLPLVHPIRDHPIIHILHHQSISYHMNRRCIFKFFGMEGQNNAINPFLKFSYMFRFLKIFVFNDISFILIYFEGFCSAACLQCGRVAYTSHSDQYSSDCDLKLQISVRNIKVSFVHWLLTCYLSSWIRTTVTLVIQVGH